MELNYWLSRNGEEAELARCAASTEARLAHPELATRYIAKAIQAETDSLAVWGIASVRPDQYWANGFHYTIVGDSIADMQRAAVVA